MKPMLYFNECLREENLHVKNVAQVYASYVTEKEIVKTLFSR